jgi:hypothetical protein
MITEPRDYGMFTSKGDRMVDALVDFAKTFSLTQSQVMDMMEGISKDDRYSEITDTAVREMIGGALGWYK